MFKSSQKSCQGLDIIHRYQGFIYVMGILKLYLYIYNITPSSVIYYKQDRWNTTNDAIISCHLYIIITRRVYTVKNGLLKCM